MQIGEPKYKNPSLHFDDDDYSMIPLSSQVVISKEVLLLTHDYSIIVGFGAIVKETIPDNSIVMRNSTKVIGNTLEWAERKHTDWQNTG